MLLMEPTQLLMWQCVPESPVGGVTLHLADCLRIRVLDRKLWGEDLHANIVTLK